MLLLYIFLDKARCYSYNFFLQGGVLFLYIFWTCAGYILLCMHGRIRGVSIRGPGTPTVRPRHYRDATLPPALIPQTKTFLIQKNIGIATSAATCVPIVLVYSHNLLYHRSTHYQTQMDSCYECIFPSDFPLVSICCHQTRQSPEVAAHRKERLFYVKS